MVALRSAVLFLVAWTCFASDGVDARDVQDFNHGWRFHLGEIQDAGQTDYDDSQWQEVQLPHTARLERLVIGADGPESEQWQGICWYRKTFEPDATVVGKTVLLKFGAAMRVADIWFNGEHLGKYVGDYLPIVLDVSEHMRADGPNTVAVRLDNFDNPDTGPKPLPTLDFNFYGGLYRGAELIVKEPLHITDPIQANRPASGGVFVTFPSVSTAEAVVRVKTHVQNRDASGHDVIVRASLIGPDGGSIASRESSSTSIGPGEDAEFVEEFTVANPPLWSPESPQLCTAVSEVVADGAVVDRDQTRIGIRDLRITADGFWLNGEKRFLRGVNRHQEYPYIGYALSEGAQYRDARHIKDAGFDYIRLSHYPQATEFLDACDELGILVMNCVMGWQYFANTPAFTEHHYKQCRELVRRDRNHPCVFLWEVALNESRMPRKFMETMHAIAHEEYPGDQCYTCGWAGNYDVFTQARQHGGCRNVKGRPCVISEYGDWEYFAQNAGLNQDAWEDLQPAERSSRQHRGAGEARLLQQALNFQEAHNDNLKTPAFADGLWVMYDYNRGYSPDLETSGCMDIFRLRKPSFYFFQSQRDASICLSNAESGPMVYIANYWTPTSGTSVRVFSNCDEVSLYLNDKLVETRSADTGRFSTHLAQPPFTFDVEQFQPGTLRAVGLIGGQEVASHTRTTPLAPGRLAVETDLSGRPLQAGAGDVVFVHATVVDANGTPVPSDSRSVSFSVAGPATLIGDNPIAAEAGIASIVLKAGSQAGEIRVTAMADGLDTGSQSIRATMRD